MYSTRINREALKARKRRLDSGARLNFGRVFDIFRPDAMRGSLHEKMFCCWASVCHGDVYVFVNRFGLPGGGGRGDESNGRFAYTTAKGGISASRAVVEESCIS